MKPINTIINVVLTTTIKSVVWKILFVRKRINENKIRGKRKIIPPIVGMFVFVLICSTGPSSLMCWVIPHDLNNLITVLPIAKDIPSDVRNNMRYVNNTF